MANRQQEKERRRQERLAAEQAAARSASRKRRLQIGGGLLVALAALAVVLALVLAGGEDSGAENNADLAAGARAAGCTFTSYRSEGRDHTNEKVQYKSNPPTSGPHNPVPAQDGVYAPGNEPAVENWVHTLEHGRVLFQYKPGTPAGEVAKLQRLAQEPLNDSPGYHTAVFQNNTDMRAQYALVAWTKLLTCDKLTAQSQDVMRQFREQYTDKAPELIP